MLFRLTKCSSTWKIRFRSSRVLRNLWPLMGFYTLRFQTQRRSVKALIATPNKETGMGATNPGGYSNSAVDATLQKALATVDDAKRGALLAEGSRTAMEDFGAIPLHFEMTTWAMRKELAYTPRVDQMTQAMLVKRAP